MSIPADFPSITMRSKIVEYQTVKDVLTDLENIFSDLVEELLDDDSLAIFGGPRDKPVMINLCPYGSAILSETELPGKAADYLDALSDIAPSLEKGHAALVSGFVKVCKIDMKILLPSDKILASTVATKLKKIKTDCSRMLKLIDQEILAIKSTEKPVAVPERERAINSIRQEFGHLLDNIDKNEVLQQIVSRDFENAFKIRLEDWEKLLGVSGRTIRKFPAWISFRERKDLLRSSRPQRSRPNRKKSTTNKPLVTTSEPLATATEPIEAATEQLEVTTEPFEAATEALEAATEPRATTTAWLEATTEQLEAITEPLEAAANR